MQRVYRLIFVLFSFGLVLMQPILYHAYELSPDESYFMFMGNSILHGAIPYINYADNKLPGIWYLLAIIFQIFGKSMYVARWTLYITNGLSAFILYLLGKEFRNEKVGMICAVFFLVGILMPAFEAYYVLTEPFLVFFSLLGLLFFIKARGRTVNLVICGISIGMATLFKQTGLLLLITLILFNICCFWIPVNRNKNYLVSSGKSTLLLLFGFLVPMLVVFCYFWSVGAQGQLVHYSILGLKGYGSEFESIKDLGYQFASFCIVWVLSCVALLAACHKFTKKRVVWETLVSIWLILSLLPLLSRQYGHYFIQILPPCCLLSSLYLVNILPRLLQIKDNLRQRHIKRLFALGCIIFLAITAIGVGGWAYNLTRDQYIKALQDEIQISDLIRSSTTINNTILVYPYQPSIYFLSDRDPCVKVLIVDQSEMEQIITDNPKFIVMQNVTNFEALPDIEQFLASNFHKEKSIGNFDIYENNGPG